MKTVTIRVTPTTDKQASLLIPKIFNDGCDAVPAVCSTTKGSCVNINTYLIAAAKSLVIKVQYVAGYWFNPERSHTTDMHCWLIFLLEGNFVPWDLAHHLKWGVENLASGLWTGLEFRDTHLRGKYQSFFRTRLVDARR